MSPTSSPTRPHHALHRAVEDRSDGLCRIEGREFYRISNCDRLPAFLMSIVSDTDLWMYVSSTGGLTAGRKNEDSALFPYETDDRIHQSNRQTGPFTLLRVTVDGQDPVLWEPFANHLVQTQLHRNLYKSVLGNQVMFEEVHRKLGLRFTYRWRSCEEFGMVRTCVLQSDRSSTATVEVLDGLTNILPAGADLVIQQRASCLINAYTQCEVDRSTGLGLFVMTSMITDKAEAADSLKANVVWAHGLSDARVLLSTDQLPLFAAGREVKAESLLKGRRGAYLITGQTVLEPGSTQRWDIVADAGRDQFAVTRLNSILKSGEDVTDLLEQSIEQGNQALRRNLASADGLQITANRMASYHHLANVLFNNMRGGVMAANGLIDTNDLTAFIHQRNKKVADECASFLSSLHAKQPVSSLLSAAQQLANPDLLRLCYEYLPITFSRRHGDPSRPWNRFSIAVKDESGNPILDYQGNWRDIFQNWEAMCTSFPDFIESVVAKFVNASTIDGFNPYRITREGIDWEAPEPNDPWANIGYWGDHQIVYLLRLLELSRKYHGKRLVSLLRSKIFSYANVPYRIKPYADLLKDRWNTIDFDRALNRQIHEQVRRIGGDGKLLTDAGGGILHVNLLEKLLVPLLSKLSNLVVDGGIWMNTQRPEWNDANNALVGNGISMVTFCYLRRYTALLQNLLAEGDTQAVNLSAEVAVWLRRILAVLVSHEKLLQHKQISDIDRKDILDQLGVAFYEYRKAVYVSGPTGTANVDRPEVDALLASALKYLDHGIHANRRSDGLFHAYNLVNFSADGTSLAIDHLCEMLEGQVAVLGSGTLSGTESADLLNAMFESRLYRADQHNFMLYPDRKLPGFLERNAIPVEAVRANPLLAEMMSTNNRSIVARDDSGRIRFTRSPRNAKEIAAALDHLAGQPQWKSKIALHRQSVLELYESVVNHRSFTGRSGTMFGYEGIGCIYWHMVSKLLLAVQECFYSSVGRQESSVISLSLADLYYRVRRGLSFNKTADVYGAFPLDPYSHTPGHCGAQQPGMTGQVKEEILTRAGELGVSVNAGIISFDPILLQRSEFLSAPTTWSYVDLTGKSRELSLPVGSLAFTICQTPVRMTLGDKAEITVKFNDEQTKTIPGCSLTAEISRCILTRAGEVSLLDVMIAEATPSFT